jgi:hypothetical protein
MKGVHIGFRREVFSLRSGTWLCCTVLGRVGEGREGSLGYAVTLVGAFADMVIHLDYVEDFMVIFIAQVRGCV